jgi:molecular chaperone GrpE
MSDASPRKINKLPFFIGDALLVCMAFYITFVAAPGGSQGWMALAVASLAMGTIVGVVPFVLEYKVAGRLAEAAALSTVMSQLKSVESIATQIRSATDNWQSIQEHSDKAAASAKAIAERMTSEVQAFGEFMQKINDNEKANLRLEVDKLRRAEADWLQVLVRTMDHVFALHKAALRSGQRGVIEQLSNFQNACRDAVRRVGLAPFLAAPGDTFDPARHQLMEGDKTPAADGKIAETIATGYTIQGRLLRPALVRLEAAEVQGPADKIPAEGGPVAPGTRELL